MNGALYTHLSEPRCRILDLGDAAVTVEFGDCVDARLQARVVALDRAVAAARQRGGCAGVIETVPTFRSLTVIFDPCCADRDRLVSELMALAADVPQAPPQATGRRWRLPVCYGGAAGPDLEAVAEAVGCDVETVIELHTATEYRVYMIGFLPGFPYLGELPERLRLPRRSTPRVRVPGGSVAVAAGLTAVYPCDSPGGWHLIGHCPVPLFELQRTAPALLAPGDRVRFEAVGVAEHARIAAALADGRIDPQRAWCEESAT